MKLYSIAYAGYTIREYTDRRADLFDLFDTMLAENLDLHLRTFDGVDGEVADDTGEVVGVVQYSAELATLFLRIAGMFD